MQPGIKNDLTYLLRILESINKIFLYSAGYNNVIDLFFANDQKDFNASLMLLINIGEQTIKISTGLKEKHSSLPWKIMRDFRNKAAHDYAGLDTYLVFEIIKRDLQKLKTQIEKIILTELNGNNFSKEELIAAQESNYYKHIDFTALTVN